MPYICTPPPDVRPIDKDDDYISAKDHLHLPLLRNKTQSIPQIVDKSQVTLTKAARLAPPSKWKVLCHGQEESVVLHAEGHVLDNWNWPSERVKSKVVATQFGRAAALAFPLALDDRIELICRLCMILVLVDDILDHLSFADGKAYNERLLTIMSGASRPNHNVPAEQLLYDLWNEMRAQDHELAAQTLQGTCAWFAGMTEPNRNSHTTLGAYLAYRERDVGMAMLSAMVRYAMNIHLTPSELARIRPLEQNFVRQYCAVNDVCSWEKEVRAARADDADDGAQICSGVQVLANEMSLPVPAAKRLLWAMAREYSDCHDDLGQELEEQGCSEGVRRYVQGMRCLMSGNEEWCLTSARYNDDVKI